MPKPRKRRNITLRPDLYQWIEERIEKKEFSNPSNAIEVALEKLGFRKRTVEIAH